MFQAEPDKFHLLKALFFPMPKAEADAILQDNSEHLAWKVHGQSAISGSAPRKWCKVCKYRARQLNGYWATWGHSETPDFAKQAFSYIKTCVYIYIYIYNVIWCQIRASEPQSQPRACFSSSAIWGLHAWLLSHFEAARQQLSTPMEPDFAKQAFNYIYIYIYIYVYMMPNQAIQWVSKPIIKSSAQGVWLYI